MFIRFFKSNNASAFILIPIIAIAIWVFAFISPSVVGIKHSMPLYELIAGLFVNNPIINALFAFILIIGEAFLLNYIVSKNEIITKRSYLPALFYAIYMSNNNAMLTLHPPLFANLFLLFAINKLLNSYRKDVAFSQAFDAGMLISIATLFYFPSIVFLPLLGIGLILLRSFSWREWVISFIGVIVPYIFTITFYFYNDILDYLWYDKLFFPILRERSDADFPQSFYFMLGVGWLIVLFSLGKTIGGLNVGVQKTKKGIILMLWFFILSGLSVVIAPEISTKYFAAMAIPTSIFSAYFFVNIKKEWIGELLFVLLLSSVFINLIAYYF